MIKNRYELLSHTGDIKIRAFGASLQELFNNALYGMFDCGQPLCLDTSTTQHVITVSAPELKLLLVAFLSECLYLSDSNNEIYDSPTFTHFDATSLTTHLHGTKIKKFMLFEIKAVTYHDLVVAQQSDGTWVAEIVFDI